MVSVRFIYVPHVSHIPSFQGVQLTSPHRKLKLLPRYQWHNSTLHSSRQQTNLISHPLISFPGSWMFFTSTRTHHTLYYRLGEHLMQYFHPHQANRSCFRLWCCRYAHTAVDYLLQHIRSQTHLLALVALREKLPQTCGTNRRGLQ